MRVGSRGGVGLSFDDRVLALLDGFEGDVYELQSSYLGGGPKPHLNLLKSLLRLSAKGYIE